MENLTKTPIRMLNVENPHKFWYRSICDDEKLQSDLSDYVSKNKVDFVPSDEQYVIVEIDNRFSVARISKVENDEKVCIQTVDGREMVIVCSNLTKLSDTKLIEVAENTMCIGSLIYISPAAKEFDFDTSEIELKVQKEWSPSAVALFKDILQKSKGLRFQVSHRTHACSHGTLTYELDTADILIRTEYAIRDEDCDAVDSAETENGIFGDEAAALSESNIDNVSDIDASISTIVGSDELSETGTFIIKKDESITSPDKSLESPGSSKVSAEALSCSTQVTYVKSTPPLTSNDKPTNGLDAIDAKSNTKSNPGSNAESNAGSMFSDDEWAFAEHNYHTLSLIEEKTENEAFSQLDVRSTCSGSYVYSYLYEDSATEEEPEQYEYSYDDSLERSLKANKSFRLQVIESLLKDARIFTENEPCVYSKTPLSRSDQLLNCQIANESMHGLIKIDPIQSMVWTSIASGMSAVLIGNTTYYPHLLYLPAICDMIQAKSASTVDGPKVVILASSHQQAMDIRSLCARFLDDHIVYSNAEFDQSNEAKYPLQCNEDREIRRADIFVTLASLFYKNPAHYMLSTVETLIINDLDTIPKPRHEAMMEWLGHRKTQQKLDQIIITSRYCMEELRQVYHGTPNCFGMVESFYDQYHFTAEIKGIRLTDVNLSLDNGTSDMILELKKRIDSPSGKIAIVCRNEEEANTLSATLKKRFGINIVVNQYPRDKAKLLICSDDRLKNLRVKNSDAIVHFELPDDFETFSRRYSLMQSKYSFQAHVIIPQSIIFSVVKNGPLENSTRLLLTLYARGYNLEMLDRRKSHLIKIAYEMNADAAMCMDITAAFAKFTHLIECGNRHSLVNNNTSQEFLAVLPTHYQFEVLHIFSPVCFSVRRVSFRGPNSSDWSEFNSAFVDFNQQFNEFYAKKFKAFPSALGIDTNLLHVLRRGDEYFRCRIIADTIKADSDSVRVRAVDFGKFYSAKLEDIGRLKKNFHINFPIQTINLCIIGLVPFNNGWNKFDTEYVSDFILKANHVNPQRRTLYEAKVQYEIRSETLFVENLFAQGDFDYAEFIESRGIGQRNAEALEAFLHHASAFIPVVDKWQNHDQSSLSSTLTI